MILKGPPIKVKKIKIPQHRVQNSVAWTISAAKLQLRSSLNFLKCTLVPPFWAVSLIYLKNLYSSLPHFYLDLLYLQANFPKSSPLSLSTTLPQATINMNLSAHYIPQTTIKNILTFLSSWRLYCTYFIKRVFLYCPQQEDFWIIRSWMPQKWQFWSCLTPKHKQGNFCPSCMGQRRLLDKVGWETCKMLYLSENCNNQ